MHYVISDIHGCYSEFLQMLNLIEFKDEDTLYILGDVIDRGKEPIKILQYIKNKSNIKLILGNHEVMMLDFYKEKEKNANSRSYYERKQDWEQNGGKITIEQLSKLSKDEFISTINYIKNLKYFEIVEVNKEMYLLVHAGIYPYAENNIKKLLESQTENDLIWIRNEFFTSEYKYPFKIIFGHTPVPNIYKKLYIYDLMLKRLSKKNIIEKYEKNKIIYFNNKIGIDGGCVYGLYLTCLRLEDGKEFFVLNNESEKKINLN